MFETLVNKIKKKFTVKATPEYYEEEFYDYTWRESLNEILFYTGDSFEDFLAYVDEDLDVDVAHRINFVGYTNDFIYYPHYNDSDKLNGFKLLPISQYGYEFIEGNISRTIH